eukprot:383415-Prymnesium_polylepis.1
MGFRECACGAARRVGVALPRGVAPPDSPARRVAARCGALPGCLQLRRIVSATDTRACHAKLVALGSS